MLLTLFYMVATWIQSWRLSSLRTRLQLIMFGPETTRPSLMLYTGTTNSTEEETNGNICKLQNGNNSDKESLSSHLCSNSSIAKLGDLLWYQGDKRLCTIYPQQKIDVSDWLLYPFGKTIFPLFTHNNAHTNLQEDTKMHVLIEADLNKFIPFASTKATKLEDYGFIVTWMADHIFGVILETDLDHITKFSTTLMEGQCFINNGLPVTRIESVLVSGKPCVCNYECFNAIESKKSISSTQWNTYVKKLKLVSSTAKLVHEKNEVTEIKEIPGVIISPGSHPITLQMPTILDMNYQNPNFPEHPVHVPGAPPPTPAASISTIVSGSTGMLDVNDCNSINFNPTCANFSVETLSNLNHSRSQDFLSDVSHESLDTSTPLKSMNSWKKSDLGVSMSSMASSRTSLSNITEYHSPSKKSDVNNKSTKPPNIIICAESTVASDNVRDVLESVLKENKYAIYTLSAQETRNDNWMEQAKLMIVCGNLGSDVASQVVEYLVQGGKLLALCSDILKFLLPAFKTAEVRENELVRFSYGKWKHIRMMHHVFCYQASPVKTKFSQDLEEPRSVTPPTPVTASIIDRSGKSHTFSVKVLGSEETWHTPSILLADQPETGGKAVFSQIHLEADPSQYEFEESKFSALKQSNSTRLEIFSDLLSNHLGIEVSAKPKTPPTYTSGFFLGRHELKLEFIKNLKDKMLPNDILKSTKLDIQFFAGSSANIKQASSTYLPLMVHRCPENFSTVEYYENLSTKEIGRLVIYADVMTSSNDVVSGLTLQNGLVIIPFRQTKGQGRGKNVWLSPEGCAMFTLQLHLPLKSVLGERLSLIQHLTTVAIVSTIRSIPGYEELDIRIKWPNDVYAGNGAKIGGLVVNSILQSTVAICNIGTAINLSNKMPTTCINELITAHNEKSSKKLPKLTFERFLALLFNELENLIDIVQKGNLDYFYDLYYKYWMHSNAEITIIQPDGSSQEVTILGIDEYGFLTVKGKRGKAFTVHPDGNSFDILNGLIAPKR